MSIAKTLSIKSNSSKESEKIGEQIGKLLKGGEILELTSDVGGGKTTLVRGIARGAGSKDLVASPTFTISKSYDTSDFTIHHFDFYRLPDAGLMQHELADYINDPKVVCIIEWADVVKGVLPEAVASIAISSKSDNQREITIKLDKSHMHLADAVE